MKDLVTLTEQIRNSQDLLKKEDVLMLSQNHDRELTSERYLNSLKHVAGKLKDNRIRTAECCYYRFKKVAFEKVIWYKNFFVIKCCFRTPKN